MTTFVSLPRSLRTGVPIEAPPAVASPGPAAHQQPTTSPAPTPAPDRRLKALRRFALSITVFNVVGHLVLGFEQSPVTPLVTVLWAYALEIGLEWFDARVHGRRPRFAGSTPRQLLDFLLPAHISAMAVAMLLYAGPVLWPSLLAVSIAIGAKHVVKAPVNGRLRHVLNPSNLGIAVVLLLFGWVGIAPPYQFTANVGQPWDWVVVGGILVLGTLLNARLTGRAPLIVAWVAGFVAQAAVRALLTDHSFVAAVAPMTGVAFVLFTNYMITDPGTTPFARRGQVAFGLGCAACYGVLMVAHVSFGLFFALVLTCLVRAAWLWAIALRPAGARLLIRARAQRAEPGQPRPPEPQPVAVPVVPVVPGTVQ